MAALNNHLSILTLFVLLASNSPLSIANTTSPLIACEDGTWPPYTFMKDFGNGDEITGASYDLLAALAKKIGLVLEFKVIPWKRCLANVHAYASTGFEMFINGNSSEERLEKYLRSNPVFQTNLGYAYHSDNELKFGNISSMKDLNGYHICGVLGYNYGNEVKAGLTTKINTVSMTVHDAMKRVMEKKCDAFLTTYQVVQGGINLGFFKATPELLYRKSPGLEPTPIYYWITRSSPRSQWLLSQFNQAIQALQSSGEADRIFKKYIDDGDSID